MKVKHVPEIYATHPRRKTQWLPKSDSHASFSLDNERKASQIHTKEFSKEKYVMKKTNHVNVKEMNFDQLFKQISPEEICDDVFTLAGKELKVITAGKEDHYNS